MSDEKDENFDLDEEGFENFEDDEGEGSQTLGDVIQSNPLAKVGIIFAAAAVLFGVVILFGGSNEPDTPSVIGGGSDLTVAPGIDEVSPAYREAIQDVNEQNREQAEREGSSAIPIPIETPIGVVTTEEEANEAEDPLQRWRQLQEERLQRELQRREVIAPAALPEDNSQNEAIQQLADQMSAQMQSILEREGEVALDIRNVTNPDLMQVLADKEREGLEEEIVGEGGNGEGGDPDTQTEEVIVPAGEIEYAQLLVEANSDVPGPVLARIVSGPLSGSKLIGDFTEENELITINFSRVIIDGVDYGIDAVALDPDTTLPGLATDVDRRYFQRIVLPMAAAFVEGVANAAAETGRTSISQEGDSVAEETVEADFADQVASGVEDAGQELRSIIEDLNEDTEPLVIVQSGTPMGILFLEAVTQPVEEEDF